MFAIIQWSFVEDHQVGMINLVIKQVYQLSSKYRTKETWCRKGDEEKVRRLQWLSLAWALLHPCIHNQTFSAPAHCVGVIFETIFHYRAMEQSWKTTHSASSESFCLPWTLLLTHKNSYLFSCHVATNGNFLFLLYTEVHIILHFSPFPCVHCIPLLTMLQLR